MIGLLIISLFCIIMGAYSLVSGILIMKGKYSKDTRPFTYWFGTVIYSVLAAAAVIAAVLKSAQ